MPIALALAACSRSPTVFLQVEPSFFFDGTPGQTAKADRKAPAYAIELLASKDGLALAKAYTAIKDVKLRRRVVKFAEKIAEA